MGPPLRTADRDVSDGAAPRSRLFSPVRLRALELRNRVAVSPMCQYSSTDGLANDWHLVHLGRFALGGAGLVIVEQTAVDPVGRVTQACLGLWSDRQIAPLARVAAFLKSNGAAAGLQLGHAGRKGSRALPWLGYAPLIPGRSADAWQLVGPTDSPCGEGWPAPLSLSLIEIGRVVESFRAAAGRAALAGFDLLEIHAAHGYLLHSFLSPLSNTREDAYGGDRDGRMRLLLEVVAAVREVWPGDRPLSVRLSTVDGIEGGWSLDDSIALVRHLQGRGVDLVDCSSGGVLAAARDTLRPPSQGSQVTYAAAVRQATGAATVAVGMITEADQAEAIVASGQADVVAIGREMLFNPNWPLHAAQQLGVDLDFRGWPAPVGVWLRGRERRRKEAMEATRE